MKVRQIVSACVLLLVTIPAFAQLNENCTVSILNRTSQVKPDGTWKIDNIPANFGPVRAQVRRCLLSGALSSVGCSERSGGGVPAPEAGAVGAAPGGA